MRISQKEKTTFGVPQRPHVWINKEILSKPGPNYTLPSAFTERSYAFERHKKSVNSSGSRSSLRGSPKGTFGVGREKFDKVVSHAKWSYQPHDRIYPGPGAYTDARKSRKDQYSLRDRTVKNCKCLVVCLTAVPLAIVFKVLDTPGPGSYATVANLDDNSNQKISKFSRSKSPCIKQDIVTEPTKHDRIPYYKKRPGPGYYDPNKTYDIMSVLSTRKSRLGSVAHEKQFGK